MVDRNENPWGILLLLLSVAGVVPAASEPVAYRLIGQDPHMAFRWPGADGYPGGGDDVLDLGLGERHRSAVNAAGAWSWGGLSRRGGDLPGLPAPFDRALFPAGGKVWVDRAELRRGDGSPVHALELWGDAPPLSTEAHRVELTVTDGSYSSGDGSLQIRGEASLEPRGMAVRDLELAGTLQVLDAPFAPMGHPFIDQSLIPWAINQGAESILLLELSGGTPGRRVPFKLVLVAGFGMPEERFADLEVRATALGPSLWRLRLTNEGPGMARSAEVAMPWPEDARWVGDSCGAGPPRDGLFSWQAGEVSVGESTGCDLRVESLPGLSPPELPTVRAFALSFDPNSENNRSAPSSISSPKESLHDPSFPPRADLRTLACRRCRRPDVHPRDRRLHGGFPAPRGRRPDGHGGRRRALRPR